MVRQNIKRVRKSSHLRQEDCAWGTFDAHYFSPYHDCVVRCARCSMLMASDFFSEAECPNCHWVFTKRDAVEMYVEARAVMANCKNWSKEVLDALAKYDRSMIITKEMEVFEMSDAAMNMMSWTVAALREAERRRIAELHLMDQFRRSGTAGNL